MASISEIAARLERTHAREFSGRELDRAANERFNISEEQGTLAGPAEEYKIDITGGGDELPGTVHLDAEGRTFGMTQDEAEALSKFNKCLNGVDEALTNMKYICRSPSDGWWKLMRTNLREGRFRETRVEIMKEIERYKVHPDKGEVELVLSLQKVYDRI